MWGSPVLQLTPKKMPFRAGAKRSTGSGDKGGRRLNIILRLELRQHILNCHSCHSTICRDCSRASRTNLHACRRRSPVALVPVDAVEDGLLLRRLVSRERNGLRHRSWRTLGRRSRGRIGRAGARRGGRVLAHMSHGRSLLNPASCRGLGSWRPLRTVTRVVGNSRPLPPPP